MLMASKHVCIFLKHIRKYNVQNEVQVASTYQYCHTNDEHPAKVIACFRFSPLSPRADWYTTKRLASGVRRLGMRMWYRVGRGASSQCRIVAPPPIDHQPSCQTHTRPRIPEPHSHIDIVYFHLWQLFDKEHIAADFKPKVIKIL